MPLPSFVVPASCTATAADLTEAQKRLQASESKAGNESKAANDTKADSALKEKDAQLEAAQQQIASLQVCYDYMIQERSVCCS